MQLAIFGTAPDLSRCRDDRRGIDRLVHHATILEFNAESYRRRAAAAATLTAA